MLPLLTHLLNVGGRIIW